MTKNQLTLTPRGHLATEEPQAATLARGDMTRLRGDSKLGLLVGFQYRVVQTDDPQRGPWKVSTLRYEHYLVTKDEKELIAFHWHPGGRGPDWPHVHIGTVALAKRGLLKKEAHIPTGRVAVEQVLRLAIDEFGVEAGEDWPRVFAETQGRFEAYRTWA